MKLIPDTIAGRTTAILIAGLILVLLVSASVLSLHFTEPGRRSNHFLIPAQLSMLVDMFQQLPDAQRHLLNNQQNLVQWTQSPPTLTPLDNWHGRFLIRHLRHGMKSTNIKNITVGRTPEQAPDRITIAVQLQQGGWLTLDAPAKQDWPKRLLGFLSMIAVFGAGIVLLAVFVTRKVTAPIHTFAAAAERFGTDISAPALPEKGPVEIRHASQAFNRMQERIRRYVQERTQMIAAISHDLRTPLTRLRLRVEELPDAEQQQKAAADIDSMEKMIKSILDFAKQDARGDQSASFDLAAMVNQMSADYREMDKQVSLQAPPSVTFFGRAESLRRAVANIIDNALRYGGQADIVMVADRDQVIIEVGDRGPGIAEEQKTKVFQPFYRIEGSRNPHTGGTGLGLSVAQGIIQEHGGDIRIADRQPNGALVVVTLPIVHSR